MPVLSGNTPKSEVNKFLKAMNEKAKGGKWIAGKATNKLGTFWVLKFVKTVKKTKL